MSSVEAEVKNQLFKGFNSMPGSMICAPAWVMPCSIGSSAEGTKLALKPPDTPAKAAAMPASGCRPAA